MGDDEGELGIGLFFPCFFPQTKAPVFNFRLTWS
jgi:hypothetical protein